MKITQDNHAHSVIAAYEYRGVIIIIHRAGSYPSATSDAGVSTRDAPHIDIAIAIGWNFPAVTAVGGWVNGRRRKLPINDHNSPRGPHATEAEMIAHGKTFVDAAIDALATIPAEYAAAEEQMRQICALPSPLSREDYEAACTAWEIAQIDDEHLSSWGDFSFPSYRGKSRLANLLHQRRGFQAERERTEAVAAASAAIAARRQAAIEAAALRPVSRRTETRESVNYQRVGDRRMIHNELWTAVDVEWAGVVSEDGPSLYGSHLLGHEGEDMVRIVWEVR